MALLVGGFGLQFAVTNPLMASKVFPLGAVGFVRAGAFVVAAIAATAGTRWALTAPGLAIVAGVIALTARTRAAAARAAADTATATHGSGLP